MHFEKNRPPSRNCTATVMMAGGPLLRHWVVHPPGHCPVLYGAVGELMLDREGNEIAALQPMMDRLEESELLELGLSGQSGPVLPRRDTVHLLGGEPKRREAGWSLLNLKKYRTVASG